MWIPLYVCLDVILCHLHLPASMEPNPHVALPVRGWMRRVGMRSSLGQPWLCLERWAWKGRCVFWVWDTWFHFLLDRIQPSFVIWRGSDQLGFGGNGRYQFTVHIYTVYSVYSYIYIYVCVCVFIYLYIYLFIYYLFIYLFIYLFLFIYFILFLFIYLSIYLSIYLFIYLYLIHQALLPHCYRLDHG